MTLFVDIDNVDWPDPIRIAEDRVIAGAPEASTLPLHSDERSEVGLWRVSRGEFTTIHRGYVEFVHIIAGEGQLIHDEGAVVDLGPGVIAFLEDGWRGRWVVRKTIVKSYATVNSGGTA